MIISLVLIDSAEDFFKSSIKEVVNFLIQLEPDAEIRISLQHFDQQGGKGVPLANDFLVQSLKQTGFKWASVKNDYSVRFTEFVLKNQLQKQNSKRDQAIN